MEPTCGLFSSCNKVTAVRFFVEFSCVAGYAVTVAIFIGFKKPDVFAVNTVQLLHQFLSWCFRHKAKIGHNDVSK